MSQNNEAHPKRVKLNPKCPKGHEARFARTKLVTSALNGSGITVSLVDWCARCEDDEADKAVAAE